MQFFVDVCGQNQTEATDVQLEGFVQALTIY
jgi:hypothetical protein